MKKRLFSIFLLVALVLSLCPTALAAQPQTGFANFKKVQTYVQGQFSDVPAGAWYEANVKTSFEMGLVNGTGSGFDPNGSMTVAQAITLAARIHSTYHTGTAAFVQGNPWYQVYVDYAVEKGIIKADEYSALNQPATRAQFAKILAASVPESALNAINNISVGSIPDVPANTSYADAVYRLYNAGVLTGSDDYGTFNANTGIKRSEAAALATRIVNPSLRRSFTPKVYDPYPPTKVWITEIGGRTMNSGLSIGQSTQLGVTFEPSKAHSGITWSSSDPSVVYVSDCGKATAHKQGTATITAKTYNGITSTVEFRVLNGPVELQYALTADGKGYEIVGCDTSAYAAHIPAIYNGLPVVSIKGGAFKDCQSLRLFTVDADQATFYEEGGVVFSDTPEKTLVVFPPAYDTTDHYYVPEGTIAVAPYAFAGLCNRCLVNITLPEGLVRLGDCAFAENHNWNLVVYVPESLAAIGDELLQGYYKNALFICYEHSDFYQYAIEHKLAFQYYFYEPLDTVLSETTTPESLPWEQLIPTDEDNVLFLDNQGAFLLYGDSRAEVREDLSKWETEHDGEIRLNLTSRWTQIVPDVNGNTTAVYSPHTGLYGAGRTESEAILRGYDMEGNLIAMQHVSGDFAYSFPGAYDIGVEGGANTHLTVIPVEPTYIPAGGNYEIVLENWHDRHDGNIFEYYIVQMLSSTFEFQADHLQSVNYSVLDAATGEPASGLGDEQLSVGYKIFYLNSSDSSMKQGLDGCVVSFGGMKTVLETDELDCMFNEDFTQPEKLAKELYTLLGQVKKFMLGTYFSESIPLQKITVCGDGTRRASASPNGTIHSGPQDSMVTYAHEMVHAVDYSVPAAHKVIPAAWAEGRAEYISYKICETYGYEYTNNHLDFDWSFISESDRADFFRYYYFCKDEVTEYDIGYHFLCYLNETYGEDISSKIMANIAALTEWDSIQRSEANAVLFKQCVESATEVGVFQNFVRDVIET